MENPTEQLQNWHKSSTTVTKLLEKASNDTDKNITVTTLI